MMKIAVAVVLVAILTTDVCNGYPQGAPPQACGDMWPHHQYGASQSSQPPFSIKVQDTYSAGQYVTVELVANEPFRGFILQARMASCMPGEFEEPVGMFYVTGTDHYKGSDCHGGLNNSVTHKDNKEKTSLSFTWSNPKGGAVFFQATVVKDFTAFWAGVKSNVLNDMNLPQVSEDGCPVKDKDDMYPKTSGASTTNSRLTTIVPVSLAIVGWMLSIFTF